MILIPYQKWVTGDVRTPLWILFAAVGLVLLIATVNVANLILTRAIARQPEVAVRLALGASNWRLLCQLVTENLVLALVGGGLAMLAAPWTVRALLALAPESLPVAGEVRLDLRVLVFTLFIAAAAGVAAGLAPALSTWRFSLSESIRQGGRAATGRVVHPRVRSVLVTGEVALSVLLLTGAILLILSLTALDRASPGFNPDDVWTFHLFLRAQKFKTGSATWDFEQQTLARLQALPGVESASVVSALPLELFGVNGTINVLGGDHETHVYVQLRSASPAYFKTMEIPLLRGRGFQETDTASAPLVVVVNEAFAHECCADGNILGRQVALPEGWKSSLGERSWGWLATQKSLELQPPHHPPPSFRPPSLTTTLFARFSAAPRGRSSRGPRSM